MRNPRSAYVRRKKQRFGCHCDRPYVRCMGMYPGGSLWFVCEHCGRVKLLGDRTFVPFSDHLKRMGLM